MTVTNDKENKEKFRVSPRPGSFEGEMVSEVPLVINGEATVENRRIVFRQYNPELKQKKLLDLLKVLVGKSVPIQATDNNVNFEISANGGRNAISLLSGTEAYPGEKQAMINAIGNLVLALEEAGFHDPGLSLRSFGVTREATPQHFLIPSSELSEKPKKLSGKPQDDTLKTAMLRISRDIDKLTK